VVIAIEKKLKRAPGLLGVAIHDYEHYRPLYPAGSAPKSAGTATAPPTANLQ